MANNDDIICTGRLVRLVHSCKPWFKQKKMACVTKIKDKQKEEFVNSKKNKDSVKIDEYITILIIVLIILIIYKRYG